MQKRFIAVCLIILLSLSITVAAKQFVSRSAGATLFHQPNAKLFAQKPFESAVDGFALRKSLLDAFPSLADKRVRRSDASSVSLIRSLLQQTVDKKLYASDFKTLSCSGSIIFNKDRSMVRPLAEMACLRNVQVPFAQQTSPGSAPFATGRAVRRITGKVSASGILSTPLTKCSEELREIGYNTLQGLLKSERALVDAELAVSSCGGLSLARSLLSRGDTHFAAERYASAINAYEDAWRRTVSCVCSSIG